jgi:DNA transformation protein
MTDDSFKAFVLDQLADLTGLACRSMFGGYGLYRGERFFGILYDGRLYFKTDDASRPKYVAWGMKPFQPGPGQVLKNYYEVPPDELENPERLVELAEEAARLGAT